MKRMPRMSDELYKMELERSKSPELYECMRTWAKRASLAEKALKLACARLANADLCAIVDDDMPPDMQLCDNSGSNYNCADCWERWLRKEGEAG